jgi:hypothetical protein
LNFPPPALCKLKTTAIYFASRKYTHQNIDNENFTSKFLQLSTANYGNISLPGNFKNSANEIFFFSRKWKLNSHKWKKWFFENSRKCNMPITIMENRIWVYLSVGFGKLNLVKDSKFWGVKIHWIINRWKWHIALEIFLTEWEILILVHNDSIY